MPGYRRPGKQEAYESALGVVSNFSDDHLNSRAVMDDTVNHVEYHHPTLSDTDIRDVAAKAIRVERGRRIGKGPTTTQIPLRLNESDRAKLTAIADAQGISEAQAMRIAIRAYKI